MRPVARINAKPDQTRAWAPRTLAWIAGLIAFLLSVSGCGGSSPLRSARQPSTAIAAKQFVAFAVCMRSHGVPGYPDPQVSSSGNHVQVTISPGAADPQRSGVQVCWGCLPQTPAQRRKTGQQFASTSAGPDVRGLCPRPRRAELPRRRSRRSVHSSLGDQPAGGAVPTRHASVRSVAAELALDQSSSSGWLMTPPSAHSA